MRSKQQHQRPSFFTIFTIIFITYVCIIQSVAAGGSAANEAIHNVKETQSCLATADAPEGIHHGRKANNTIPSSSKHLESIRRMEESAPQLQYPIQLGDKGSGGKTLLLQWQVGDDLFQVVKRFKERHGLLVPPDCRGKTRLVDLEWCLYDHLSMFMTREMMLR